MKQERLVLAAFIDALGWEIIRSHRFLPDLLAVCRPVRSTFGYSSTCVPTILTGEPPRVHGHFSSFYYDPQRSPFRSFRWLSLVPGGLLDRGRVRRYVSRGVASWHGYDGYFQLYSVPFRHLPLFDYAEKKDLYQPGGVCGGVVTFLDRFRESGVPLFLSDWRASEEENLARLETAIDEARVRFAFLYLGELDGVLHEHGTRHERVEAKIAQYQARLSKLVDLARQHYGEVRVHVFSDHGMADVSRSCDLLRRVENTGLSFGEDYVAMYDSTMARFWFLRTGARERIEGALRSEPLGRILTDNDLSGWGCDFPGHKYGELFFLVEPGALICPSFMGTKMLRGMHGYEPDHPSSVAMYASSVPDIKTPEALTDIFDLLCAEVGT